MLIAGTMRETTVIAGQTLIAGEHFVNEVKNNVRVEWRGVITAGAEAGAGAGAGAYATKPSRLNDTS